jgi:DNA-binding NarL/FixJ family response regulator
MHDEELYAERALRAGAKGYITKNEASTEVIQAIRCVMKGEVLCQQADDGETAGAHDPEAQQRRTRRHGDPGRS